MQDSIVIKSDNSIILTAHVMIPGAKDCDYWRGEDPFTVEQVQAFKEAYDDYGFIDDYHSIRDVDSADKSKLRGDALKSFLLSEPTSYKWFDGTVHTYPTGTWMLTSEITDPVAIKEVQEGIITGYSPSVFKRETAEKIRAALKESASLKASAGGLIKNITDPVPALVSLVRKPCQHGNKFCKTNVGEKMSDDKAKSKLKEISAILRGDTPEYATKEDIEEIEQKLTDSFKSDEFKEFIVGTVNEAVANAVKDISLKEDKPPKEEDDPKEGGGSEGRQEGEKPPKEEDDPKEPEGDDQKPATKEDSKKLPQHDGDKPALKSDRAIVLEAMGRDMKGRPKRQ